MAKGGKQKTKLRQQPDEPRAPKPGGDSSQAARRVTKSPPPASIRSQDTFAQGHGGAGDTEGLVPGGWGSGGGGWGQTANSGSWDFTQSQLVNQPPPSRSPAPNPPSKNAAFGSLAPPSRHSPSSRNSPSIDGDEQFAQTRDSFEDDQEHDSGPHGHGWDSTLAANNQPTSAGAINPAASSAHHSPTARRTSMSQGGAVALSPIAELEAAQAAMKAKGVKLTSASAAARKAEAGNPNLASNRDSLWLQAHEKAHEAAEARRQPKGPVPFIPSNRPVSQARPAPGKRTGPVVPDWESDMGKTPLWKMTTPPAWMAWGGGMPAKPPPQPQPPSQPPPRPIRHPQVVQHKKQSSWQHWGKPQQTQPVRHAPPSDESSEEEEWEDDETFEEDEQWGQHGHGHAQHAGAGRGGGWGAMGGGHEGRHPGAAGGGGWGNAAGGGAGRGGGWDDGGWERGAGGGGGGGGGWEHPSTSKVTFAPPAEDARGSRNVLSSQHRTQIFNSLLNADLAQAQQKHGGVPRRPERHPEEHRGRSFEDPGVWGAASGGDAWGAQPSSKSKKNKHMQDEMGAWGAASGGDAWGAQPTSKSKKSRHKQDEMGAWGAWGQPEDDWGASQAQPKAKNSKKQKDDADGWGAWGMEGTGAQGDGRGGAPPAAGGWADGWDPPPSDMKSHRMSKKHESHQADAWGNSHSGRGATGGGDWGDIEEEDEEEDEEEGTWGGGGDQSWAAWKAEGQKDSSWGAAGATGAWDGGGGGGWGGQAEDDHRGKFSQGGGAAAFGVVNQSDVSMSHTMSMAQGSRAVPGGGMHKGAAATNVQVQHQQGGMVKLLESGGAAFGPATNAFFNANRPVRDRFHWMFPPDKDEHVAALMTVVQTATYELGAVGLTRFLETRERGALFTNASFRLPDHPNQPVFDWLNFDVLQKTMDKTLQESVAFYDPAQIVIVFVYLPSHTGNSVAIWRRKIPVPGNIRRMYQQQIDIAKKALRQPKDYVVFVEELPPKEKGGPKRQSHAPAHHKTPSIANPRGKLLTKQLQAQLHAQQWPGSVPTEKEGKAMLQTKANDAKAKEVKPKKKKKRWWNIFSRL